MVYFILFFSLLKSASAFECGDLYAPVQSAKQLDCIVDELIRSSYPELKEAFRENRISFSEISSKEFFLQTNFKNVADEGGYDHWQCIIEYNPVILESSHSKSSKPSAFAIQGILAHELIHLVDYENGIFGSVLKLGLDRILFRHRYERNTDLRAFERGYALGIKEYRIWIYSMLGSRQLKRKKRSYYTPEEIDEWLKKKGAQILTMSPNSFCVQ